MAGVNILVADTDEEAEALFTSLIRMFVGVLTSDRQPLQPPTAMTADLREVLQHPAVSQMLACSFYGSNQTVKTQVQQFLADTGVDELITVLPMHNLADRLKSVRLFTAVMAELNG